MSVLSKDIGLKLAGLSWDFPGFGRVTMVARRISEGTLPSDIAWLKTEHIWGINEEGKVL